MFSRVQKMQQAGEFMLSMISGSSLNWLVIVPYLKNHLWQHDIQMEVSNPYLILSLNVGMIIRLILADFLQPNIKIYAALITIIVYSLCWIVMAFIEHFTFMIYVVPNLYMVLLGFIFLDPIERTIKNDYIDQDKQICFLISGWTLGWMVFALLIQFIFNHELNTEYPANYVLGCLCYALMIFIIGMVGLLMFIPQRTNRLIEEVELPKQRFDAMDYYNQRSFLDTIKTPFAVLFKTKYYIHTLSLFLMYCPGIGTINYIQNYNDDKTYAYIAVGLGTFTGNYIPILFRQPFSRKPILGLIQILMMLVLSIISVAEDSQVLQLFSYFMQFILFGTIISFGILILQSMFDIISNVIPFTFISLTLATAYQFAMFNYTLDVLDISSILIFNFMGVVVAYILNLFLPSRFY